MACRLHEEHSTKTTDKNKENMVYFAANASRMKNMVKKQVHFRSSGGGGVRSLEFQVPNVQKPLASARRVVERATRLFAAETMNCKKVMVSQKDGIYTLPLEYLQAMNTEVFARLA